jgi:8-oxo-dGTP pyrophosphatase MutT (NUDIX family)/phosphohistidine phosphatase SixA
MADQEPVPIESAGALVWRAAGSGHAATAPGSGPDGIEVVLVHRQRYDDWAFPKGKREAGEALTCTAVREVAEETGLRVRLGRRLGSTSYTVDGRPKRVDYWAAVAAGEGRFSPNDEVDGVAWLPVAAARGRLSYPHDVRVLDEFTGAPAATVPIIVVRHAFAVSKDAWRAEGNHDDLARPLSDRGSAQATRLADLLLCYPPARIISSPAERCVATVRPYAAALGAPIATESLLVPDGLGPAPGAAARDMIKALLERAEPLVICAHRENIPALLALISAELGSPPVGDAGLRKGELWALHVAGGRLVSVERQRPAGR